MDIVEEHELTAQFNAFFSNVPVGIGFYDRNLCYVRVNEGLARINERSVAEHLGRTTQEISPATGKILEPLLKEVLYKGQSVSKFEFSKLDVESGSQRYFQVELFPIRFADGSIHGVGSIFLDVTHLKKEPTLTTSKRTFPLFESNLLAMFFADFEGQVTQANDAFLKLVGYSREEQQKGKLNWRKIIPPEYWEQDERIIEQLKTTGRCELFETEYLHKNGKRIGVLIGATIVPETSEMVAFIIDLTDRTRAEDSLRESQEGLRLAFAAGLMGSWTRDLGPSNRVVWSPELSAIFGYQPDEFQPTEQAFFDLVYPDDRAPLAEEISQSIQEQRDYNVEFRFFHRNGTIRWMIGRGRAFYTPEGVPWRLAGIGIDITARKEAEEALQNLNQTLEQRVKERTAALEESNAQMEAFLYSVSHDLRTPLQFIQGFSEAVLDDSENHLTKASFEYLHRITGAISRMDTLLQDLLVYSRLAREEIHLQPINLEEILIEVLAPYQSIILENKIQVNVIRPLPIVLAQNTLLFQVLSNLISNAIKFTAEGESPFIRIYSESKKDRIRLWIEDNGIGIDAMYHERIFRIFERLHGSDAYPGTGIGLTLVQKAIERMGGSVGVESQLGKGSRFWIELKLPSK